MTTCSATLMLLQYVTSATVTPLSIAACRSTWSEPMPAVIASFRLGAFAMRSAVRYAGQNGCEMTTSASGSARSNSESGPSLSAVTISVCPRASRNAPQPELAGHAAEQLAGREVDRLAASAWPARRSSASISGMPSRAYDGGYPSTGSS